MTKIQNIKAKKLDISQIKENPEIVNVTAKLSNLENYKKLNTLQVYSEFNSSKVGTESSISKMNMQPIIEKRETESTISKAVCVEPTGLMINRRTLRRHPSRSSNCCRKTYSISSYKVNTEQ